MIFFEFSSQKSAKKKKTRHKTGYLNRFRALEHPAIHTRAMGRPCHILILFSGKGQYNNKPVNRKRFNRPTSGPSNNKKEKNPVHAGIDRILYFKHLCWFLKLYQSVKRGENESIVFFATDSTAIFCVCVGC